jgi:hypothetical protein
LKVAVKEAIINVVFATLNRSTSSLSILMKSDEAREHAETFLRICDVKYSVEPDGSLSIENANELLLSGKLKLKGKGPELLLGPPRTEPARATGSETDI